jgi:hypothetical protein
MPDKRIDELPDVATLPQDGSQRLMLFGNYLTGKLYKGIFTIEENWKTILSASFGGIATGVPATTTYFAQIFGKAGIYAIVESDSQFVITEDCTIKNLFVNTINGQSGTGNMVITLRVNGSSTALSVTLTAGAIAGTYSNTTDEIILSAGDLICYQLTNNASAESARPVSIGATLIKTA